MTNKEMNAHLYGDDGSSEPSRLAMEIAVHMEVHAALSTTTQAKAREIDALLAANRQIIDPDALSIRHQGAVKAEPVAWLHTLHMEGEQENTQVTFNSKDPFGTRGLNYDPTYICTSEPLYRSKP